MPLCRNWRCYFHPIRHINIEMRGHRCNDQEEWSFSRDCLFKKAIGLLSYNIGCIETFIADRLFLIPLPSAVKVGVGVGVKQEIRSRKASRIWGVVVVNVMSIEELASVVGIDSCILQPYREVFLIQALAHKLGITACSDRRVRRHSGLAILAIMEANLTIRRRYVGDIGVMCSQSRPEIDARGATDGDGAVMVLEG